MPSFITVSMSSALATFSYRQNTASFSIGTRMRLAANPGLFLTSTGALPIFCVSTLTVSNVASDVCSARISSTSCIIGTGLKKCMPITCAGRLVAAAILVSEIDEVFEARIACGLATRSRSAKILSLRSTFSVAASTTTSQPAIASRLVAVLMRPSAACLSASLIFCFASSRSRLFATASAPRLTAASLMSVITTSTPLVAITCAMPLPMVPAPTMPTFFTSAAMLAFTLICNCVCAATISAAPEPGSLECVVAGSHSLSKRFLPAQIDEPVNRPDQQRSADDVSDRYRQHVAEKVGPGQRRKIRRALADRIPELVVRSRLDEQSKRNEIGICNAVLEARGSERGNRRNDRHGAVDIRARAEAHPHRYAHERVAQDAERERRHQRERRFGVGRRKRNQANA